MPLAYPDRLGSALILTAASSDNRTTAGSTIDPERGAIDGAEGLASKVVGSLQLSVSAPDAVLGSSVVLLMRSFLRNPASLAGSLGAPPIRMLVSEPSRDATARTPAPVTYSESIARGGHRHLAWRAHAHCRARRYSTLTRGQPGANTSSSDFCGRPIENEPSCVMKESRSRKRRTFPPATRA